MISGKGLQHADVYEAVAFGFSYIESPDLASAKVGTFEQLFFPLVGKLLAVDKDEGR